MDKIYMRLVWLSLFIVSLHFGSFAQQSVITRQNDVSRTGWNNKEVVLNTSNVRPGSFGKIFSRVVDDELYAQPLVVLNVNLPVVGVKNVVYLATTNNTVYAFDADSANVTSPYWQVNLTPAGSRVVNVVTDLSGACGGNYKDFANNVGIVGTPVIDTLTGTMYLVSRCFNQSGLGYQQWLHALDIKTGAERPNSPKKIMATINAFGSGNVSGKLSFDSLRENQRSALLLSNDTVYIAWAGHCDWPPYHGWILGYNKSTLQQVTVYCTTPSDGGGGIWMSAGGLATDGLGNIYGASGNGYVFVGGNPSTLANRSTSALKLTPNGSGGLNLASYFTPNNFAQIDSADLDFGPSGVLLIPNTNRALADCKDGKIYLMNRDNMGGLNLASNNVLQTIDLGINAHLRANFAYYNGQSKEFVYVWSENSLLKAFPYSRTSNLFDLPNTVSSGVQGPVGNNGAFISISSNGSIDSTAILWASFAESGDANHAVRPGILRALSASDITQELWNSSQYDPNRPGNYAKFSCPTVSNGKVYLGTFSNQLCVYGLTGGSSLDTCTSGNLALGKLTTASSLENSTYPASNATDGNASTRWSSQFSDPQWISIDLGSRYDLCKVVLRWEAARGKDFTIQISDDNINWTVIQTVTGNTSTVNSFNLAGSGRYVRMYGTARVTVYGYSLYEFEVYGRPSASNCPTPINLSVGNIGENGATLHWFGSGVNNYAVQYKTVSELDWVELPATQDSLVLTGLACSSDYLFRLRAICGVGDTSIFSGNGSFSTLACSGACGPLPTRWTTQDIGATAIAGSACYSNGVYSLFASGSDIGGTQDAFHYAYTSLDGDGEYIVRVADMDASSPLNKSGIMIREDLSAGSRNVFLGLTSGNGVVFQSRSTTGGSTTSAFSNPTFAPPFWIRLVKSGSIYTGYSSSDGINWTQLGVPVNTGFGLGTSVYAGLASTSHDNSVLSASSIDNYQFTAASTLPVVLQSFNAFLKANRKVGLEWTTTMERDFRSFVIERSGNGVNFTDLTSVPPKNGGVVSQSYSVDDNSPLQGLNFYRLRLVDKDGTFTYSQTVLVRVSDASAPLMFPNPARGTVYITAGQETIKAVGIFDMTGRMMKWMKMNSNGAVEIPIQSLANGLYVVKIITGGTEYQERLMVQN